MKICYTTLACPKWDLDTILARTKEYGFDGLDLRGYLDMVDVTLHPAFTTGLAETQQKIADSGVPICGISTSIKVCVPDAMEANLAEARRTIQLANALGAKYLRIFGMGDLDKYSRSQLADFGMMTMQAILSLDGARELHWLFETHDQWVKSADCRILLDRIPDPAFGVLWDMGHTPRVGGEMPAATFAAVGPRVAYTHVKDAAYDPHHPKAMTDGWRYTFPGQGSLPLVEAINTLKSNGYTGWIVFEHEKRWHPELPEPEEILPAFVKWVRPLL